MSNVNPCVGVDGWWLFVVLVCVVTMFVCYVKLWWGKVLVMEATGRKIEAMEKGNSCNASTESSSTNERVN